jgi:hypothetical protein
MNDSNRGRFSVNAPSFENFPSLILGPGTYEVTRWKPRSPRGQVMLHKTSDGVSERQKGIYGTPIKKILPISATSYNPRPSLAENSLRCASRPSSSFVSCSGRKLWEEPPNSPSPLDYSPTPVLVTPRPPTAVICSEERPCNSSVRRDPMPTISPNSTYSQRDCSPLPSLALSLNKPNTPSASRDQQVSPVAFENAGHGSSPRLPSRTPGIRIPVAKRHLNIHNINSAFDRSRDGDFDNPPPGTYEARSPERHKEFSVMRGTLNGIGRN